MIVTIKSKGALAEIDTMGAQVVSFKDVLDIEYLWQGDASYWSGQAPILFPIVGALRGGKTKIDGKYYEMKRHGFARYFEFSVIMSTDNMAVLSLCATEETKKMYPFDFELRVTYRMEDTKLIKEYTVINKDTKTMPFVVGGHPAFNCPVLKDDAFENYIVEFEQNEVANCPAVDVDTGLILPEKRERVLNNEKVIAMKHSLFYRDALVFDSLKSKKVKLYSRLTGKGVEMEFKGFAYLGIWSAANDAPFVALEPWTGCATCSDEDDNFENKRGMTKLAPNETFSVSYSVNIL